jgi:putative peptide zinc metalloprotease protein
MPFFSSSWYRVAKLRPRLRKHLSIHRHRYRGSACYVVHDHATGRIHRLDPETCAVVGAMDGVRTVDEIWSDAVKRLGEEAPGQDETIRLLAQLYAADLIQTEAAPDVAELFQRSTSAGRSSILRNALNPFAWRMRLWNPDRFLERSAPCVNWLFGWGGALLWVAVVVPAVLLAAQYWRELSENAAERILAADNLLMIGLSYPILKALHELGHGYAIKAHGGAVPEIGVMFIVFLPMPYVDASAASEFRSKWRRALVGAAGMIVEVFVAALAIYTWLAVEPGLVRAVAFNVILVAGVSTLLFNGNPLLRFDGYYILADLLEIPNLAQRATRYWGHLVEKYAFRLEDMDEFAASSGERAWLLLYAPTSFVYRQAIILAIALFVASEYLAVGVAIAVLALFGGIVVPFSKAIWKVVAGPRLRRSRTRAATVTFTSLAAACLILFVVPAPLQTTTEGVVWLPETAIVRAGTDGFVRRLLTEPGRAVGPGEALIESEEPTVIAEVELLRARVAELESKLASERFIDRVSADITRTELRHAREELATKQTRVERLVVHSSVQGLFAAAKPEDLPGRFFREGQEIGYVLPSGSDIVRVAIRQDDIDLVRSRVRSVTVKLSERLEQTLRARIVREVPGGAEDLPSKVLGTKGGGAFPIDPRDGEGTRTLRRVFQLEIALPADGAPAEAFGSRAYVRFDHHWEPIGLQMWRRVRQLLLSRLQT